MQETSVDLDGVEVAVRTAAGKAQVPALVVLACLAVLFLGMAGWMLVPRSELVLADVDKQVQLLEDQVTAVEDITAVDQLEARRSEMLALGEIGYARCRIPQLVDDVRDRSPAPALVGGRTAQLRRVLTSLSRQSLPCRPESWLGPGSQLDVLPAAVVTGVPIDNPYWASDVVTPTVRDLAEAELRLWPRMNAEWELLQSAPLSSAGPSTLSQPSVTPQWVSVREAVAMDRVLALVASALVLLGLAFLLAFVPDRVVFRFDLRGIRMGRRHVQANRIEGVWVDAGRLVVLEPGGVQHRSPLLADASELEPIIAQYQRLSSTKRAEMPAAVRQLIGEARKA